MILAEKLLLCLTDDDTGKLVAPAAHADIGLGGAVLVELTLRGHIGIAGPQDDTREGRLLVRDPGPTGDALLDAALTTVGRKQGKKPKNVVAALGRHLRTPLYQRLAAAGVLRPQDAKFLGVLPSRRWPTEDAREEAAIRANIAHALRTGTADDPELAALVSVLRALDVLDKVVDLGDLGLTKRQARDRAQSIAEGDWAGEAVRQAIDTMNAAVIAATTSTVVTGGGGS